MKTHVFLVSVAIASFGCAPAGHADEAVVPVATIYPGDVITAEMLIVQTIDGRADTFLSREALVGRTARRTLLPGRPIAPGSVGESKIVKAGSNVQILFESGALSIRTRGVAMQTGSVGDAVSVRNAQTGRTVTGIVAIDGSVQVAQP